MSDGHSGALRPIALQPDEGEALWFMGMLTTIKASKEGTGGKVAVIEHTSPYNSGSPLHVHHREDEWFYVLEGELTIWVGGRTVVAGAGAFLFGPRDVPHTFVVSSEQARFLLVTQPAGFEGFLRALGMPGYQFVVIGHPISNASDEQLAAYARVTIAQARGLLLRG